MQVHSPNPEEVFRKWLETANDKLLSKRFKKYISKTLSVSSKDTIISSETTVFALIQVEERPADIKSLDPKAVISLKELRKKGPYWEFTSAIEYKDWKGAPLVIKWDSIKPDDCNHCNGKGFSVCSCSKGFLTCRQCKGKFSVLCPECGGKAKFTDIINVKISETSRIRKEKVTYNCSTCYGNSKIICNTCGGSGRELHAKCKATAKNRCEYCKGTGKIVELLEEPVPIKRKVLDKYITPYDKSKKDEEQIIEILKKTKHQIPKYEISDESYLGSKQLDTFLPEISKTVEKFLRNTKKELEILNKRENEAFYPPLYLFPGLELFCQSSKGHKFEIVAIGDEKKYAVSDVNWRKH
ncbi:MAG: hypothetical protein ACW967_05260 [Candidatus Hodarchaeales archaeon]|jgi:hypothetical protein